MTPTARQSRVRSKRPFFIFASIGLGAIAALAASALVFEWWSSARRVQQADTATLKAQLDFNPKALYVFDEATSYRLKPLFIGFRWGMLDAPHQTNSRGLLGSAEIDPTPTVRKVVFLGDSVTYGDGVAFESVFVSRMQQMAGAGWQLLNAGTPGWSTRQELRYYDRHLWDIPWRAVVIVFCLNDLVQYEWVWGGERALQLSDEMQVLGGLSELKATTAKGLELLALRSRFHSEASTAPLGALDTAALRAWSAGDWNTYTAILEPWLRTKGSVPVVIVMAPARGQLKALALGGSREVVLWPQLQMAAICARTDTLCIDPIDGLRPAGTGAEIDQWFRDELHFTEAGHRALARFLWPRLQSFVRRAGAAK